MSPAAVAARADIAPVACLPCWNDWAIRLGGVVRPVRHRQDGAEDLGRQVPGASRRSAWRPTRTRWPARPTRASGAICDGNGYGAGRERQPAVQRDRPDREHQLRPARRRRHAVRSGPAARRPTGKRRLGPARAAAAHVGHGGLLPPARSTTIQYTKNTLVDPVRDYTPFTITVPPNPKLPDGGGEVITLYNLNPDKRGVVNSVQHLFGPEHARLQRLRIQRQRTAAGRRLRLRRHHHGADRDRQLRRPGHDQRERALEPNNFRFCDAGAAVPDALQGVGRVHAALRCAAERLRSRRGRASASDRPTPSTARQPESPSPAAATGASTVVDPTTQYYDYVKTIDMRASKAIPVRGAGGCRCSPRSSICRTRSTILTVNETVGPLYFNPQAITQGRRAQFGAQIDW